MMKAIDDTPPRRRRYHQLGAADRDQNVAQDRPIVLLVDDIADNLLALEAILRGDDFEIVTALSGREALDILLVRNIALAIIDVHMPEMDGFELATLMRGVERTRYVPIVFVTAGLRDSSCMFKGYEVGAVDYLWKPIDEQILRSKVDVFVTLERQRQQLLQAERMREMFVGVLGHDLRNPLQGMLASAERAALRTQDEVSRRLLDVVAMSGGRMNRMIEQMLDLTRIRLGGGISIRPAPTDLRGVVEQILDEFPRHADRLIIRYVGETRGSWDVDRLFQLVSNLVGNAIEHSPPDSLVEVRIDGSVDDRIALDIRNGGPGLAAELQNVLFEPFHSGDRTRGLGLGLFICKQIVLAHGGAIDCESSDATGTRFYVTLPRLGSAGLLVAPGAQIDEPPRATIIGAAHDEPRRRDVAVDGVDDGASHIGTILLVDDDRGVRDSLTLAFTIEGYRVVSVADGDEAARCVSEGRLRPDIVVVDFHLPKGVTGVQTVRRLREMVNADVPAVILTGDPTRPAARPAPLERSVRLSKPADFARLMQTMRDLLTRSWG
jgi:signal transduction histidine kinase